MDLRTLTIHQPYAWWIIHGRGEETGRSKTNYRGPFLVHAGLEFWMTGLQAVKQAMPEFSLDAMYFGVVIGAVTLVDCHADPLEPGKYLWTLEDPIELTHRDLSGSQGWWGTPATEYLLRELEQQGYDPRELVIDAG